MFKLNGKKQGRLMNPKMWLNKISAMKNKYNYNC